MRISHDSSYTCRLVLFESFLVWKPFYIIMYVLVLQPASTSATYILLSLLLIKKPLPALLRMYLYKLVSIKTALSYPSLPIAISYSDI